MTPALPSPSPYLRLLSHPLSPSLPLSTSLVFYIVPESVQKQARPTHILAEGRSAYKFTEGCLAQLGYMISAMTETKLLGPVPEPRSRQLLKCNT